jgi:hypothetical protein
MKQKDTSSLFAFNFASVYGIRKALGKLEGLEFSAIKCVIGVALTFRHHRIVSEARVV